MESAYKNYISYINSNKSKVKKKFSKWKSKKDKSIDHLFHSEHEAAFEEIDCLKCANCCKTTSPIFRDIDIKRIAKHLKVSEQRFISDYLIMDNDGDYVLKTSPCFFLQDDNTCSIYNVRPLACAEYPHTNRKNMYQILSLTKKNTEICPAVAKIVSSFIQ